MTLALRSCIALSILVFACQRIDAQTSLDNLQNIFLTQPPKSPSERLNLMIQITERMKMKNLPEAVQWADSVIALADREHLLNQLARGYELKGDFVSMQGNFVGGASYFDKSIRVLDALTDSISIAQRHHAMIYSGGWLTPLFNNEQKIKSGLIGVGIYTRLRQWKEAGRVHHSLGIVYLNRARHETPNDEANDPFFISQAKYHNEKAEELYRMAGLKNEVAESLESQGENYFYLEAFDRAMLALRNAEKLFDRDNNIGMAECKWHQALIYQSKHEISRALQLVKEADDLLQKAEYNAMLFELYDLETELRKVAGDFQGALASASKARKLRDEIYTFQRNALIAEIQNSYENKLQDEHLKTLSTENALKEEKLNRTRIILAGLASLLTVVILSMLIYSRQKQRTLHHERKSHELSKALSKNLEEQLRNAQLTAARAQMDPHFIYNSINAIQNLILKENKTEAITYLNDFSRLSRQTLDNASHETVLLKDEISFLENYIHLEQLRAADPFSYEVEIEAVDPEYDRIPTMLIQPLLENAVKHGVKTKGKYGRIVLSFTKTDEDFLRIIVDDNGVGRAAAAANKTDTNHHSRATYLTQMRMDLMASRKANKDVTFHIEDKVDKFGNATGTKVTLTLPLSVGFNHSPA